MEGQVDRITELPCEIINNILCRLPIKEAGMTSVLSSKWRYRWAKVPDLVFDGWTATPLFHDDKPIVDKLVSVIDTVLVLHEGPINSFSLCDHGFNYQSWHCIDRWILHLSRRSLSLKALLLSIREGSVRYKGFRGFKNLKTLDLESVTSTRDAVEYLISSSPLLERLLLRDLTGVSNLRIEAPNLMVLEVGHGKGISFKCTGLLSSVTVYMGGDVGDSINALEFFGHVSHVQYLELGGYTLKHLVRGLVGRILSDVGSLVNLKVLDVCINFDNASEVRLVWYLLRSSPNLKEVIFWRQRNEQNIVPTDDECWDDEIACPSIKQLRRARFYEISGSKAEMEFIECMLSRAIVMEKMIVIRAGSGARANYELLQELLEFPRASPSTRVVYHGSAPFEP